MNRKTHNWELKEVSWNHTEAVRKKSAGDGVGGSVKEMCNQNVLCRGQVLCAQNMINVVPKKLNEILHFLVFREKIETAASVIPEGLNPVPQTMKVHQFTWSNLVRDELKFLYLTCKTL